MFGIDDMLIIAGIGTALSAGSAISNFVFNDKANRRADGQLEIQKQQLALQKSSLNESLRSNYYGYMQQLSQMQGELGQNQLAINQQRENIASNQNYLDRWASEYDLSMQNGIDETYSQYQQLASNYSAGLVSNAETGRRGGSAGRMASDSGMSLRSMNGGSADGFNLSGSRLGAYLNSSALDMMADKQTAISSLGTSYKAIDSYQNAMSTLTDNIGSLKNTTTDMAKKLKVEGLTV